MPALVTRLPRWLYREPTESNEQRVLENLTQIVFQLDTEYRWSQLNNSWERITGFSREHSLGKAYQHFIHPEDQGKLSDYIKNLHHQAEDIKPIEARIITNSGEPRWTEIYAVHINNTEGHPVCVGTMTDISERIAEEALLHARNRSLSGLLNDLSGMVYRCRNDKWWTMEYLSGGCKSLTGYPPSAIVNNSKLSWDSLIHPEDHDMVWAEVQNGVRENRYYEISYRMFTADNKEKWLWERGKGIFSDDGELLGLEGYIIDVTANKLQQEKIVRSQLYDADTGLVSTPLFEDRLARAIQRYKSDTDTTYALLIIQFHRLLETIEKHGQDVERTATKALANRLQSIVDASDSVCQLKTDRYAILLDRKHEASTVAELAKSVLVAIREPVQTTETTHVLTCSIGFTHQHREHKTPRQVIHEALVASNSASAEGGSHYGAYDSSAVYY